jgi:putative DNA methylase
MTETLTKTLLPTEKNFRTLKAPRLIEHTFPLKQASIDSVHEKNVRHGHISTLHIWPARRPLAACRAALIATLLPDPGTAEKREELIEKIGGKVVQKIKKKKLAGGRTEEKLVEETEGGILHWGRETENKETIDWFREEIRKAYGGRAPRVLDPFAGGGAIPLEAMRLGCEVTAIDLNPVAWLILKCTLEYPQKLAREKLPLPSFVMRDREFMESFFKAEGFKGAGLRARLEELGLGLSHDPQLPGTQASGTLEADLAWHVRAWGWWVLKEARKELAPFYLTYADFEPLEKEKDKTWEMRDSVKVPTHEDGTLNLELLNSEFSRDYLADKKRPRWVAKPTVAYLWARTVECKNCRALIPLLKTRWLCKKDNKRVALTMETNEEKIGVTFGVQSDVPQVGGNATQRRENDKKISQGTMSRSGVWCPCCGKPGTVAMTMEDIRQEGLSGRLGATMTAVVIDGPTGKNYRLPTEAELNVLGGIEKELNRIYSAIPSGRLWEPIKPASTRSISCDLYGIDGFSKAFTLRQQLALGAFVRATRAFPSESGVYRYSEYLKESILDYLGIVVDRIADRSSVFCRWDLGYTKVNNTFSRFSLPMLWDYCEANPISDVTGGYSGAVEWVAKVIEHCINAGKNAQPVDVVCTSATAQRDDALYDLILTDPPYYQAISYADLSDFFYIWQKRIHADAHLSGDLSPKEDEIVQHVRADKDRVVEKAKYEDGMYQAFCRAFDSLREDGRFAIVFAHKDPNAWETLASALIRSGFVVSASWPIQTEMGNRGRAQASAALASSLWLVCKKRPGSARPGWDNNVLDEMRENIHTQLREFWDAGIRGPDFVWAATGPALEAYSKHPIVKKANEPGQVLTVAEFLRSVRRIVVDFVVGRVLSHNGEAESATGLDDLTTYYLLHRNDFRMEDAPIGACILYAVSCGLSDTALADQYDILIRTGGNTAASDTDEEENESVDDGGDAEVKEGTGSLVRLVPWNQRKRKSIGYETVSGRPVPLIDQVHRLMHLWKSGEIIKVDEYLDASGLRRNALFHQLLQALIELAVGGSEERSLLESISNHVAARGVASEKLQISFPQQ